MAETFLEEQLRRIRTMIEQVSRVRPLAHAHSYPHWPEDRGAAHQEEPQRRRTRDSARRRRR